MPSVSDERVVSEGLNGTGTGDGSALEAVGVDEGAATVSEALLPVIWKSVPAPIVLLALKMISPALAMMPAVVVNGADRRSESMLSRLSDPPPSVKAAPARVAGDPAVPTTIPVLLTLMIPVSVCHGRLMSKVDPSDRLSVPE